LSAYGEGLAALLAVAAGERRREREQLGGAGAEWRSHPDRL
jgi:hypothetical protein